MKYILLVFLIILLSQNQNLINSIDSLINNPDFIILNEKHSAILGRDSDPKKITDISKINLFIRKTAWTILTTPGLRFLTNLIYPKSTISHFNVENAVAFTIDDGFCGKDNKNGCMINEVRELFNRYNANATFFVTGTHCNNKSKNQVNLLLNDGHEIANHNMMDWSYNSYSYNEFEFDLLLNKEILSIYNQEYSSWYRAPMGQYSKTMDKIIKKHKMKHVVADAFGHDTSIPDPEWISNYILKNVKDGSIILIHMPEKGVREWTYKAMELTLQGLKDKNLSILNLSQINELEKQQKNK